MRLVHLMISLKTLRRRKHIVTLRLFHATIHQSDRFLYLFVNFFNPSVSNSLQLPRRHRICTLCLSRHSPLEMIFVGLVFPTHSSVAGGNRGRRSRRDAASIPMMTGHSLLNCVPCNGLVKKICHHLIYRTIHDVDPMFL